MKDYVVVDIETTGLSPTTDAITEIGAVKVKEGQMVETYQQIINPERAISPFITNLTGITDAMVASMPKINKVMPDFIHFCEDLPLVGHNIMFDYSFLKVNANRCGFSFEKKGIDTVAVAKRVLDRKEVGSNSLDNLCDFFKINREQSHRALEDAMATYKLLNILVTRYYTGHLQELLRGTPLVYREQKLQPITAKQEKFLKDLIRRYEISPDINPSELTKSEASRMIDNLSRQFGRQ